MKLLVDEIIQRFRELFPTATQSPTQYEGKEENVSGWIAKDDEGRWRSIGIRYPDEHRDDPSVHAALHWLSDCASIPLHIIDDARLRSPTDKTEDVRPIERITLRALFDQHSVCVRVDAK